VGGTRERHFAGTNSKPHKVLENAQTPTRRVHAVLGSLKSYFLEDSFQDIQPNASFNNTEWITKIGGH
jgi:hypothetical protein